jgi:hypothetical protein
LDKAKVIELIDANAKDAERVISEKIAIWAEYELFSGLWWMGVGLAILPWIAWLIARPRKSTDRLLYVGGMVALFSVMADVLGDQFAFWHYRFNVIPILPTYIPWDITLMPVTVMFFLQIKPKANPYLKALLYAVLTSYVAEPVFHALHVYNPQHWRYSYSVPIQFALYLAAHWMMQHRNRFDRL